MTDCPHCEYHRQRAQRWREEVYKLSGHPLPEHQGEEHMIKYDGYDEAIIGPAYIWRDSTHVSVLVYDAEKIRDILMKRDGMSHEDAREFIEYNIEGGYLGAQTPVLVWPNDIWDWEE